MPNLGRRLAEAARLGYEYAVVPAGELPDVPGMRVAQAATLREAIGLVAPRR